MLCECVFLFLVSLIGGYATMIINAMPHTLYCYYSMKATLKNPLGKYVVGGNSDDGDHAHKQLPASHCRICRLVYYYCYELSLFYFRIICMQTKYHVD